MGNVIKFKTPHNISPPHSETEYLHCVAVQLLAVEHFWINKILSIVEYNRVVLGCRVKSQLWDTHWFEATIIESPHSANEESTIIRRPH